MDCVKAQMYEMFVAKCSYNISLKHVPCTKNACKEPAIPNHWQEKSNRAFEMVPSCLFFNSERLTTFSVILLAIARICLSNKSVTAMYAAWF